MTAATVYAIAWDSEGPTKIGIARSPLNRLISLQTACPFKLKIFAAYVFDYEGPFATQHNAVRVERRCHEVNSSSRLEGEWFRLSVSDAVASILGVAAELGISTPPAWAEK